MNLNDNSIWQKNEVLNFIKQAIDFQKVGNLECAESLCTNVLISNPKNPDALHLLGVLHHQTGRTKTAIDLIAQAIRICPSNPFYYNNLGSAFKNNRDFEKAIHCYQKALSLKSDYPEALYNMAGIYHVRKKYDRALTCYQMAVKANPKFPEALNNMAVTLNILGRYDKAVMCCKKAIAIKPNYSEPFNNMGNAYKALNEMEMAIQCYEKSMTLAGESAEVLCNLANVLQEKGEIKEAVNFYEKAIIIDPNYGKAYNNLGTAFRSIRKLKVAERNFKRAIALNTADAEAYHNLGNIRYDSGDFDAAAFLYDKAISIDPESVQSFINRGIIYQESSKSDDALECFKKALELDSQNSKAHSHMVHELFQRCEWFGLDGINAKIDKFTERELANGYRPNEMPFLNLIRKNEPLINFRVAERWSRDILKNTVGSRVSDNFKYSRSNHRKITIGYLSNNFRNHPTSHLVSDIFNLHDRSRFEIYVYSYGEDDHSAYREKIRKNCDKFIDLAFIDNEDAANQLFNHRVDILVDLVGYMRGNRLEICAYRPAPIQVRWLGFAGTTGANFFDYIITDRVVTPQNQAAFYSEKFVYLPDTYQVNSKPILKSKETFTRNDFGLPDCGVIYCCFCSNYKIEKRVFSLWIDILKNVPNSVLWLMQGNSLVASNLKKEAQRYGVDSNRIVFANKIPKADHLERLQLADIALDTIAVNGAATTSDALSAGIPVITLKGNHFASRMSASILKAIDFGDLVFDKEEGYRKKAIELGGNPLAVVHLKKRLENNRLVKPLFNTERFVANLEKAFTKMWEIHQCKRRPEMIWIH